jgi:hypothetical protein
MRLPPSEIDPGMWVNIPQVGTGMVLDVGEYKGLMQLGVLLEFPATNADYYVANLYRHDFIEVQRNNVKNG